MEEEYRKIRSTRKREKEESRKCEKDPEIKEGKTEHQTNEKREKKGMLGREWGSETERTKANEVGTKTESS